ncbi:hypothetical protein F442_02141 [Phytophthora nicotianae P10297]|uniref:Uncharacterized protein n=3 Tax=Phytophthora nicotianae TaxID=4792 RepID=V9FXG7_PHYNI|nr:hypothetical protein F443_02187 [Phytophthora nicotianae P1569]ETP52928.1 hypothetical protein F442_02141 [Phytophthora nicotianae P10297]KUF90704.1 hypothetical protein AM587_10016306 [Phytophthora nicotianae]KUF97673.1 hypothetical protein AM588_10009538 [Phytophthora nicotianae]
MAQNGSSPSTCGRTLRRCSRSERSHIHRLATIVDEHTNQSGNNISPAAVPLLKRSKSERVIRTTQGVKFEDKDRKYQTRLDNLKVIAADPCSSKSNALIAQKALRYRNKIRNVDARP